MVHTSATTTVLTKQQLNLQDKQLIVTTHQPQTHQRYIIAQNRITMQTQKRRGGTTTAALPPSSSSSNHQNHNWRYQSSDNWNNNVIQHSHVMQINNGNNGNNIISSGNNSKSWRNKSMDASPYPETEYHYYNNNSSNDNNSNSNSNSDNNDNVTQRREGGGYEVTKKVLGKGANSSVVLGYEKTSFRKVAIKQIMIEKLSSVAKLKLQKEIEILNMITAASTSDRLLKILFVSSSFDNRIINIVTEYIPGSDLFELVTSGKLPSLPSPSSSSPPASTEINNSDNNNGGDGGDGGGAAVMTTKGMNKTEFYTQILYNIIEGVKELHDLEICHLDLKLENIMYNPQSNRIKIIDFGFSQFTVAPHPHLPHPHHHHHRHHSSYNENDCNNNNNSNNDNNNNGGRKQILQTTYCGSVHYAAPELLKRQPFDGKKADIWSLGVMAYAMFSGKFPFDSKDGRTSSVFEKIRSSEIRFPAHFPSTLCDLLSLMMHRNPSSRCSIDTVLSHPFFSTYNIIAA